jgi:hypothetical protein
MENGNRSNWKWIVALAVTILLAAGGWVFAAVKSAGEIEHKLLFAQDEMLYDRSAAIEKLDMVQDARLNILESQVAVVQSKIDMMMDLLMEIRKAVK